MKKKHIEPENHERWLVSYADFITLLFAFFVVMYAISSVNLEKYKAISESIENAFNKSSNQMSSFKPKEETDKIAPKMESKPQPLIVDVTEPPENPETKKFEKAAREMLADPIDENMMMIRSNKKWTEIEIKSNFLFESGSAEPHAQALVLLKKISEVLKNIPYPIIVEGYADDIPISTEKFPSNWELSGARAAAVVRVFIDNGVEPTLLSAVGFGEQHPIAENLNEEGRNKNRRVLIVIAWSKAVQEFLEPIKRRQDMKEIHSIKNSSSQSDDNARSITPGGLSQ